jgi:hypothetical protein
VSLAELAAAVGRRSADEQVSDIADIITFVESDWGLGLRLYPVQRVILKAHYGMELDDNPHGFPLDVPIPKSHPNYDIELTDLDGFYKFRVHTTDWRREKDQYLTEAGYLRYLYDNKRCNIREVIPGKERREMVLSVGRRSGKTLITSCIVAYETYKLLLKGNAQHYYGVSASNVIQLISVATDRDQAGLLYQEASGHFQKCDFYKAYTANATQSFATFQTPHDIDRYGSYRDNPKARYSVKVTFKSCVAKGLRGGNNILVALDEAAHFGEKGQASADEVYQAVEPSTRTFSPKDPRDKTRVLRGPDGKHMPNEGRIILISSPLGKQGLFYKQYLLGFGDNQAADNLLCIQAPTWEVNPTVPAETFVGSYLKDPAVFFTEFGAEFTDRTRGWLESPEDLLACIDANLRPKTRAAPRMPHFMGLDVALVGDYSALAIGHNDTEGRVVLDAYERIRAGEGDYIGLERLEFEDVADWVRAWSRRFYIEEGIFDQWAGIPMEQSLKRKGLAQLLSVHHTRQLSSRMFQNFKNLMMDRKLVLYDWPLPADPIDGEHGDLIAELLELQAEYISKYIIKVEAPDMAGKHDDLSDAVVRMVWCATQNGMKTHAVTGHRSQGGSPGYSRFGRQPTARGNGGSHPSRQIFPGSTGRKR